jgi:hypothetical protein
VAEAVGSAVAVEVALGGGAGLADGVSAMTGAAVVTVGNAEVGVGGIPHRFGGREHAAMTVARIEETTASFFTASPAKIITVGAQSERAVGWSKSGGF